jgi:hypothetical protein
MNDTPQQRRAVRRVLVTGSRTWTAAHTIRDALVRAGIPTYVHTHHSVDRPKPGTRDTDSRGGPAVEAGTDAPKPPRASGADRTPAGQEQHMNHTGRTDPTPGEDGDELGPAQRALMAEIDARLQARHHQMTNVKCEPLPDDAWDEFDPTPDDGDEFDPPPHDDEDDLDPDDPEQREREAEYLAEDVDIEQLKYELVRCLRGTRGSDDSEIELLVRSVTIARAKTNRALATIEAHDFAETGDGAQTRAGWVERCRDDDTGTGDQVGQ